MPNVDRTPLPHNTKKAPSQRYNSGRAADVALFLVAWRAYHQWSEEPDTFAFHTINICFPDLSFREFLSAWWMTDKPGQPDDQVIRHINYIRDIARD